MFRTVVILLFATSTVCMYAEDFSDRADYEVFLENIYNSVNRIENYWTTEKYVQDYLSQYHSELSPEDIINKVKKTSNNTYTFDACGSRRVAALSYDDYEYSWPFEGCMSGPKNSMSYSISMNKIVLKITQEEQLGCDFYDNSGAPKAPKDFFNIRFACKGKRTIIEECIMLMDDQELECTAISTCTHSMRQVSVYRGAGSRIVGGVKHSWAGGQPYAPWRYKHTQTISYDLSKIAKQNKISTKELVYTLIVHGIEYLPTVDDDSYYASVELFDRDAINYALWKLYFPKEQDKAAEGYLEKYRKDKCLTSYSKVKDNYSKIKKIKYRDSIPTTVEAIRKSIKLAITAYEMKCMPKEHKDSLIQLYHLLRQQEVVRLFYAKRTDYHQYADMLNKAISDYSPNKNNFSFYKALVENLKRTEFKEDAILLCNKMKESNDLAIKKYALNGLVEICIESNQPLEALNNAYKLYYLDHSCDSEVLLCIILHKNNQIKEVKTRWKDLQKKHKYEECVKTLHQYLLDNKIIKK